MDTNVRTEVKRDLIVRCIVCRSAWDVVVKTKDHLDMVRACALPCGHQGVFTVSNRNGSEIPELEDTDITQGPIH